MSQYIAFGPQTQVLGRTILTTSAYLSEPGLDYVLSSSGLGDVRQDAWYPQQAWLNVLKRTGARADTLDMDLVVSGIREATALTIPGDTTSVMAAVRYLADLYQETHRHLPRNEGIFILPVTERHVRVTLATPYPDDYEYGLLYGLVRRMHLDETALSIHHDPTGPCRKAGDHACIYDVIW